MEKGYHSNDNFSKLVLSKNIFIRPYIESDYSNIRNLFEISFPIKYDESFYSGLQAQTYKGLPLKSFVAVYKNEVGLK